MIRGLLTRARSVEGRRAVALAALVLFVVCVLALSAHAAFEGPGHSDDCGACSALASLTVPLLVMVIMLVAAAAQTRRTRPASEPVLSFEPRRIAAPRGPPVL